MAVQLQVFVRNSSAILFESDISALVFLPNTVLLRYILRWHRPFHAELSSIQPVDVNYSGILAERPLAVAPLQEVSSGEN